MNIEELEKEMQEIAARWNGDESGYMEEQATIAIEIIEKIHEIQELIKELNGTA